MRKILTILLCLIFVEVYCISTKGNISHNEPLRTKIVIKINNPSKENKTVGIAINKVGFGQETYELPIEKNGNEMLSFEFQTYIPTDVWITHATNFLLLVHPGDSLYIEFDGRKKLRPEVLESILISGTGSDVNKQICEFQKAYYGSSFFTNWKLKEEAIKSLQPKQFREFADSIKLETSKFLTSIIQSHKLENETIKWAQAFLDNHYYGDLTFYPDLHRKALVLKQSEWNVPLDYYDFFENHNSIEETMHSGYATYGFGDKYLYKYIRLRVNEQINLLMGNKTDQPLIDSLYLETITKHTKDTLLKEIIIAQYFNDRLAENDVTSYEHNSENISSNISSVFLKEPLFQKYKALRLAIEESNFSTVIKSNSSIDKIIEAYKGSPIYIDVWATWCGPCKEEFPYANDLKSALDEIVFVYLCIDSTPIAFQNTLKRFQVNGNHYFLSSDESKELRDELNIDGIPNYILIDKTGVILYSGYKLRPSEDNTKEEIIKLLNK